MADISQTIFSDAFFEWSILYFKIISPQSVAYGPIDTNLALVQIMAWSRIGDKPLSEPILIQFTDAYMRHKGEMG